VLVLSNSLISVISSPSYDLLLNKSLTTAVFFFCCWCGQTLAIGIGWTLLLGIDDGPASMTLSSAILSPHCCNTPQLLPAQKKHSSALQLLPLVAVVAAFESSLFSGGLTLACFCICNAPEELPGVQQARRILARGCLLRTSAAGDINERIWSARKT
jgi:hypothetical protein